MSNPPKPRLSSIGEPIKPYTRAPTRLGSIGDPMSELNIQRRWRWIAENRPPGGLQYFTADQMKADPAVAEAVRLLYWCFEKKTQARLGLALFVR